MSIYADPVKYARMARITIGMAEIWCAEQLRLAAEIEAARTCPKCGKPTLTYEIGCYEEGYDDYIHCENDEVPEVDEEGEDYYSECEFLCEPNKEMSALAPWYDFDVLLAMKSGFMDEVGRSSSLGEWIKFAKEEVSKIKQKAAV
jgi:hypothetical protein